jgi:hypothetical protein
VFDNEHSLHLWKRHPCTSTGERQLTDWREQVTTWRGLLCSHSGIVCINPIELYWIATINKYFNIYGLRDFSITLSHVEWYSDYWIMLQKGFGRKWECPNWGTVLFFTWMDWVKQRRTSDGLWAGIWSRNLPHTEHMCSQFDSYIRKLGWRNSYV